MLKREYCAENNGETENVMSKYNDLWEHIAEMDLPELELDFREISNIVGFPLDHSFLKYKKELEIYGFRVEKISMKLQTVYFKKI